MESNKSENDALKLCAEEAEALFLKRACRFVRNDGVIDEQERAELERLAENSGIDAIRMEMLIEEAYAWYEKEVGTIEAKQFSEEEYAEASEKYTPKSEASTRDEADDLLGKEEVLNHRMKKGPLAKFFDDFRLAFAFLKDWSCGRYREVPWRTIAMLCGALLYVLSPIDLIPDFIPGIGLLDDAAVFGAMLAAIHEDLQDYKAWRDRK